MFWGESYRDDHSRGQGSMPLQPSRRPSVATYGSRGCRPRNDRTALIELLERCATAFRRAIRKNRGSGTG